MSALGSWLITIGRNARALFRKNGSLSTKSIASAVLTFGGLMQVQQIRDSVLAVAGRHPRIASLVGMLTTLVALLHEPKVQQFLGIQTTVENTISESTTTTVQPLSSTKELP